MATLWVIGYFLYSNDLKVQFTSIIGVNFTYLCFHTPKISPHCQTPPVINNLLPSS